MSHHHARSIGLLVAGAGVLVVFAVGVDDHLDAQRRDVLGAPSVEPIVARSGLNGVDGIAAAQQRLERVPGDWATWAQLGLANVEQARITADPSYYPKAEGALEKSLELRPDGNTLALAGMGALANARHDFSEAARWANQALEVDPASHTALGVLADARIQLGQYERARQATQRMLDVRPDLPALTRASYDLELQGRRDDATEVLRRALDRTNSAAGMAWVHRHLAQLAFDTGDLDSALSHLESGLRASPEDPALQAGMARVLAAMGKVEQAIQRWETVVAARPLPEHLAEYGAYLTSLGRDDAAARQFELFGTVQKLFQANGVADDLTAAYLEADFGDPASAVEHAQRERERRSNIDSADAMAWALHSAGRNREAIAYAKEATARGRDALMLYHRGMIEKALGRDDQARDHLVQAIALNPHFSPFHAPRASRALEDLVGR